MIAPGDAASAKVRTPFASREFAARVASAIVLGAVVLSALVVGGWPFAAIWLAAGILGAGEWLAMSGAAPSRPLLVTTSAALAALCVAVQAGAPVLLLLALLAFGIAALLLLAANVRSRRNSVAGLVAAVVIVLVPAALRDDPGIGLVGPAWMFAVVWSTDIVAYFTGRSLGGPKLMPRVSPKKTWSGALGGLAAGTLAGLATVLIARGHGYAVLASWPLLGLAAMSAVASVVSQAGDLFESALKRVHGVKDSGRSIPGHGGVMDRLDGFFPVALLVGAALVAHSLLAS